jgi:hypothetical protein
MRSSAVLIDGSRQCHAGWNIQGLRNNGVDRMSDQERQAEDKNQNEHSTRGDHGKAQSSADIVGYCNVPRWQAQ